ncbi:acyl carrier protein [Paenibacillus sp. P26]|nr:acyl carrier protein [Paenibacillus sp. P26]UUZ96881.1 acyl carrier protein [Paenibacillus sp. P25]
MVEVDVQELHSIIGDVLRLESSIVSEIDEETDLRNYNLSSISAVELLVMLEDRFDMVVPEDESLVDNLNTIYKIKQLVLKYA